MVDDGRVPAGVALAADVAFIKVSAGKHFYTHGLEKSRRDRVHIDIAVSHYFLIRKYRHLIIPASTGQQLEPGYRRCLGDW
jgi:hypothetical protein